MSDCQLRFSNVLQDLFRSPSPFPYTHLNNPDEETDAAPSKAAYWRRGGGMGWEVIREGLQKYVFSPSVLLCAKITKYGHLVEEKQLKGSTLGDIQNLCIALFRTQVQARHMYGFAHCAMT